VRYVSGSVLDWAGFLAWAGLLRRSGLDFRLGFSAVLGCGFGLCFWAGLGWDSVLAGHLGWVALGSFTELDWASELGSVSGLC
jgi:hypothetical protein